MKRGNIHFGVLIFLVLFFKVGIVKSQSNSTDAISYIVNWDLVPVTPPAVTNPQEASFGSCVCDLTFNQCDINCCCDPDCSYTIVETSFSKCLVPYTKKDFNYMCVQKTLVTFSNLNSSQISTKEIVQEAGTPLFCVYFESASIDGLYYDVVPDLDSTSIKREFDRYEALTTYRASYTQKYIYDLAAVKTNVNPSAYQYGDRIPYITSDPSGNTSLVTTLTYFTLHRSSNSDICEKSFVRFMKNNGKENRCVWVPSILEDFRTKCLGDFSVSSFTSNHFSYSSAPETFSQYFKIELLEIISVSSSGTETALSTIPTTTYTALTNTCTNAVIGSKYYLAFTSTGSISQVYVTLRVKTLEEPTYVELKSEVNFINGTISDLRQGIIKPKSGNPGYIRKKPLVAGYMVSNSAKSAIYQQYSGLTAPTGYGCSSKKTILFDVDAVYSCSLTLTLSQLKTACTSNSFSQLESDITYVGRYGNADNTNINDWVLIVQDSKPSSSWDELTKTCNNIAGGIEYQVVISKSGSVQNEQWKIQGIKRSRYSLTWAFAGEDTSKTNTFWIETRVKYIRTENQETIQKNYPAPNFLPFLPEDVFYPFSLIFSGSSLSFHPSLILCLFLSILTVLIL